MINKEYLYNTYNATSTSDENGELETYENWLERQLISRLERIDKQENSKSKLLKRIKGLLQHIRYAKSKAFDRSVDYKPFSEHLPPQKYYEKGFEDGAKWFHDYIENHYK